MKIDRLRKLDQFVDYINGLTYKELCELHGKFPAMMSYSVRFFAIVKYNDFLKQPLTKEMFVNEIEKLPQSEHFEYKSEHYKNRIKEYAKSEKKVISEELRLINGVLVWGGDQYKILGGHFKDWSEIEKNVTLSSLAEKTNGKLKLKNVSI